MYRVKNKEHKHCQGRDVCTHAFMFLSSLVNSCDRGRLGQDVGLMHLRRRNKVHILALRAHVYEFLTDKIQNMIVFTDVLLPCLVSYQAGEASNDQALTGQKNYLKPFRLFQESLLDSDGAFFERCVINVFARNS